MLILAIETSGDVCSVCVCDADGVLAERAFRHRMQLSQRLIGDVNAALEDSGSDLHSIDGLAVGIGPGSFTGVRIGVTTAKTWAHLLQKPVAGISSLEALANEYSDMTGASIFPLVRNRPDSVHFQPFYVSDGGVEPNGEAMVVSVEEVAARIPESDAPIIICGDGFDRHREALRDQLPSAVLIGAVESPRASIIAAVARRRFMQSRADDPLSLLPLYVAPPPIGPPSKRTSA